jgi:hypothetical protein
MGSCGQSFIFQEFFIYLFFHDFAKNIWSVANLAKIYICRRGSRRQGLNAAARGVRSRQEWARSPNATGHAVGRGVRVLTPGVSMALG